MILTRADVERIARLARLALSDREIDEFTPQLGQILEYVESLGRLDTTGIEPMSHPVPVPSPLRDDVVVEPPGADAALGNAPARLGDYFLVPKVIE